MTHIRNARLIEHPAYGRIMVFGPEDSFSSNLAQGEIHEPRLASVLASEMSPGEDFMDVGAHIGITTLGMFREGGRPRVAHCFEPRADAMALLEHNVRGHPNVRTYSFALSAEPRAFTYGPQGCAGIDCTRMGAPSQHVCAALPLDGMDALGFFENRVGLMKVDVETHEVELLTGARSFLARHRPTIVIELHNSIAEDRKNLLRSMGYELVHKLTGWEYIWRNFLYGDYVFKPRWT